eukprot:1048743-Prymnesium_polylepis.3
MVLSEASYNTIAHVWNTWRGEVQYLQADMAECEGEDHICLCALVAAGTPVVRYSCIQSYGFNPYRLRDRAL